MTNSSPFVILRQPCDEAVRWASRKLEQSGFQTVRTFDLQAARLAHLDCPCPHHGTSQCNCQMVVLLVYQGNSAPVTMVVHGTDETSWFYLINIPQQPVGQHLEKNIEEALSLEFGEKI
ncbi:MAG: hypothetical protein NTW32_08490 [Chloroflexi bacterium]|nr:hypothetical protein [Chloroflexota bacterium]